MWEAERRPTREPRPRPCGFSTSFFFQGEEHSVRTASAQVAHGLQRGSLLLGTKTRVRQAVARRLPASTRAPFSGSVTSTASTTPPCIAMLQRRLPSLGSGTDVNSAAPERENTALQLGPLVSGAGTKEGRHESAARVRASTRAPCARGRNRGRHPAPAAHRRASTRAPCVRGRNGPHAPVDSAIAPASTRAPCVRGRNPRR